MEVVLAEQNPMKLAEDGQKPVCLAIFVESGPYKDQEPCVFFENPKMAEL